MGDSQVFPRERITLSYFSLVKGWKRNPKGRGMSGTIKPFVVSKHQAKELLPPKLVDRFIYACRKFPEMGWLEILPPEPGKEARETYIVYESLEKAFNRVRTGEYPPEFPSDIKDRQEREQAKQLLGT